MPFTLTQFRSSLRSWRFCLALAIVALSVSFAIVGALYNWHNPDSTGDDWPSVDLCFVAVLSFLAFFFYLPESVDATPPPASRSISERWASFAFLAVVLDLFFLWLFYFLIIRENYSYVFWPVALPLILACSSLVPIYASACGNLLAFAGSGAHSLAHRGFSHRVRSIFSAWGRGPLRLGPRVSFLIGAILVISSIFLPFLGGMFSSRTGLEAMRDQVHLLVPEMTSLTATSLNDLLFWVFYLLSLALGLIGLAAFFAPRIVRWSFIRRILLAATVVNCLFQLFIVPLPDYPDAPLLSAFRLISAIGLLLLWLNTFRSPSSEAAAHTRLFLAVLPLPFLPFWIYPFTVQAYFAPGFGTFIFGLLFILWGFLQSRSTAS